MNQPLWVSMIQYKLEQIKNRIKYRRSQNECVWFRINLNEWRWETRTHHQLTEIMTTWIKLWLNNLNEKKTQKGEVYLLKHYRRVGWSRPRSVCKLIVLTWGSEPQYCLKAPKQLISLVRSSSGVSMHILQFREEHKHTSGLVSVVLTVKWFISLCKNIYSFLSTYPENASSITSVFCLKKI